MATLLGYFVSDIACVIVLYKMKLMELDTKFFVAVLVMLAYFVIWRIFINSNYIVGTVAAILVTIVFLFLYRKEIGMVVSKVKAKTLKKQKI